MTRTVLIVSTVLLTSAATAAPPAQDSIKTVLGPKAYRDGDVIEFTNVTATSPRLEQGDTVTVRGRVRLDSQDAASLSLFLTQTEGDGKEEVDSTQTVRVSKGITEFELKATIKHRGYLHVTMYDLTSGKPIGGAYFGTAEQMKRIADWNVDYYLAD
jgi:hypothetical protein